MRTHVAADDHDDDSDDHDVEQESLVANQRSRPSTSSSSRRRSRDQGRRNGAYVDRQRHHQHPRERHDRGPRRRRRRRRTDDADDGPRVVSAALGRLVRSTLTVNGFLRASLVIWFVVQARFHWVATTTRTGTAGRPRGDERAGRVGSASSTTATKTMTWQITERLRKQRWKEAKQALGTAAGSGDGGGGGGGGRRSGRGGGRQQKRGSVEDLPEGCAYAAWQTASYPTCNVLHEIDLTVDLGMVRFGKQLPDLSGENTAHDNADFPHYVGSGLWRNVWRIERFGVPSVLKTMKMEHEVDARNFDRHRRDAIVMERHTSHPNVVGVRGFCGNSVLTQYARRPLDDLLFEKKNVDDDDDHDRRDATLTRRTPEGRIRLAIEISRGVAALHGHVVDGSNATHAVLHADLQAKQFLVDDVSGRILLNDFNRCRFTAVDPSRPDRYCRLRIPSAPGNYRSPEEYDKGDITDRADVFSLAHVLYVVLYGKRPFDGRKLEIAKFVKKGGRPKTPAVDDGGDALLREIVMEAYAAEPERRPSAAEIVQKLEAFASNATTTTTTGKEGEVSGEGADVRGRERRSTRRVARAPSAT